MYNLLINRPELGVEAENIFTSTGVHYQKHIEDHVSINVLWQLVIHIENKVLFLPPYLRRYL